MSEQEHPILFTGESVRAILDGRKTQTRRVITQRMNDEDPYHVTTSRRARHEWLLRFGTRPIQDEMNVKCPYGQPGDRLWVRETWRPWSWHEGEPITVEYRAGGDHHEVYGRTMAEDVRIPEWEERLWISLTDELDAKGVERDGDGIYRWEGDSPIRWRPSIHMPRWASRITLAVTGVRVEQVQEISAADAIAEGVFRDGRCRTEEGLPYPVATFRDLWDSINAKRGYSWASNPWVWVVEFERAT